MPRGVQVVVIYIREAHAHDVWPIGNEISRSVLKPRTSVERCKLAHRMCEELSIKLPLLVDPVQDLFEAQFAPWPFRFYVLDKECRLRYKAQPTQELTYCTEALELALERLVGS